MITAAAQARQTQMAAVRNSGIQHQLDRLERTIGALKHAATGLAASVDSGEEVAPLHIDGLFGLLTQELNDTHEELTRLV